MMLRDLLFRAAAERRRALKALEKLRATRREARHLLVINSGRCASPTSARLLVEEARLHRQTSIEEARHWAELALLCAQRAEGHLAADARAEAWAELGNAHRMAAEWDLAGAAFRRAGEELEQGSGDPVLAGEVTSLEASLLLSLERPAAAAALLSEVTPLVLEARQDDLAIKLLVKIAIAYEMADEPEAGLRVLAQAWRLLPEDQEGPARVSLVHETIHLLTQVGRAHEALVCYDAARSTYRLHGSLVERARGRWIAARAVAALGDLESASVLLRRARETLESEGRAAEAAVLRIDQALVEVERAPGAARRMVLEALPLLAALGLPRSTMAALRAAGALEVQGIQALREALEGARRVHRAPSFRSRNQPSGSE